MKLCIWYHTVDRQPDKSGYYMSVRTITLADATCGVDYFYYNKETEEWRTDSTCHSRWANVYYWTEEDPEKWVDSDPPVCNRKTKAKPNPALEQAWEDILLAVERYEIIKVLTQ
jgi:hypothetical protein